MTLSRFEATCSLPLSTPVGSDAAGHEIASALSSFDSLVRKYFLFHLILFSVVLAEFALMLYFFNSLSQTALISVALSVVFLTCFSYFILRIYWQTNKDQQILDIKNEFVSQVKLLLDYQEEVPESHIAMTNSLCKLAESLNGREYSYYLPHRWLNITASTIEKLSCWGHWRECHRMKEAALKEAVDEQIKLVKCEPTNPEAHASLANAYILLAGLYSLSHSHDEGEGLWGPSRSERADMQQKFRIASERAIEEFKIISNYAPHDPWIHEQLAYSYRDLQMPAEEIREYEQILRLMPSNTEILYKLGALYFEQGKNAQGLQLYEQLRHANYKRALALIKHYGAYTPLNF